MWNWLCIFFIKGLVLHFTSFCLFILLLQKMSNVSFSRSFMKCGWIKFKYTIVFIGKWNYALPSRQMHHLPKVEVMLSYLSNKSQNQDYRSCFYQEKHSSWTLEWYFETKLDNECYKRYVMEKTLNKLTEAEESHSVASEDNGDDEMKPRSKRTR